MESHPRPMHAIDYLLDPPTPHQIPMHMDLPISLYFSVLNGQLHRSTNALFNSFPSNY